MKSSEPTPDESAQMASRMDSAPTGTCFQARSKFNDLFVVERDGVRYLTARVNGEHQIQSAVRMSEPTALLLPYTRVMCRELAGAEGARDILVIGLGLGSIAAYVAERLPSAQVDCVEIDPEVASLYERYGADPKNPRITVVVDDFRAFVGSCKKKYDFIFFDAYLDGILQAPDDGRDVAKAFRGMMMPAGCMYVNFGASDDFSLDTWQRIASTFAESRCLDAEGHAVVVLSAGAAERTVAK